MWGGDELSRTVDNDLAIASLLPVVMSFECLALRVRDVRLGVIVQIDVIRRRRFPTTFLFPGFAFLLRDLLDFLCIFVLQRMFFCVQFRLRLPETLKAGFLVT